MSLYNLFIFVYKSLIFRKLFKMAMKMMKNNRSDFEAMFQHFSLICHPF